MRRRSHVETLGWLTAAAALAVAGWWRTGRPKREPSRGRAGPSPRRPSPPPWAGPSRDALRMIREGRQTFRHDTFGDEAFWGDALQLHRAIAGREARRRRPRAEPEGGAGGRAEGGRGGDARRTSSRRSRRSRSTWTTRPRRSPCLKLDAVVGVKGFLNPDGSAKSVGITVRPLPLDGGRRLRAGHRPAARRLAEPRPERRQDHLPGPELEAADRPARGRARTS